MSSRPRRSAAQRATAAITDLADRDRDVGATSPRLRRSGDGRSVVPASRRVPSSSPSSTAADSGQHIHLTVKLPASKLRQAAASRSQAAAASGGAGGAAGRRAARGGKRSYVVESESDEDEEDDDAEGDEEEDDEDDEEGEDEDEDEEDDEEGEDEIKVGEAAAHPVDATMAEDEDDNGEEEADDGDEDEEDEEEDEEDEEEDAAGDLGDDDAEGEEIDDDDDAMDVDAEGDEDDAEGEEDAEGDIDMGVVPRSQPPTIRISKPSRVSEQAAKAKVKAITSAQRSKPLASARGAARDEDDDDELSELESDAGGDVNDTVEVGGDEDAEGEDDDADLDAADAGADADGDEEIEVADEDAEGEDDDDDAESDDGSGLNASRAETPDLTKMTKRQRARFEDIPQEYMKLSDEVQVKKVFTAEELSMRRAEMARRRRNLSDKRNEEVKMETINKLLKKQAPKTKGRHALLGDETPDSEFPRANPAFVRWISTKQGNRVAVPGEMLAGPAGRVFTVGAPPAFARGKMVQEV